MPPTPPLEARALNAQVAQLIDRLRPDFGRKATGIIVAIVLELVLLLLLLMLGQQGEGPAEVPMAVVSFDAKDYSEEAPAEDDAEEVPAESTEAQAAPRPDAAIPDPPPTTSQQPAEQAPALIPITPRQMESFDISRLPRNPSPPAQPAPSYGPQFAARTGDSERVGTAPNGRPMYAAAWYREPTDDELAGYLSTASGPGWALITCKTAPGWRVEDCVGLGEYPQGSMLQRAVLAAAWQFKVRPPRINGTYQVGEWVRIRIEYNLRPARQAYGPAPG